MSNVNQIYNMEVFLCLLKRLAVSLSLTLNMEFGQVVNVIRMLSSSSPYRRPKTFAFVGRHWWKIYYICLNNIESSLSLKTGCPCPSQTCLIGRSLPHASLPIVISPPLPLLISSSWSIFSTHPSYIDSVIPLTHTPLF